MDSSRIYLYFFSFLYLVSCTENPLFKDSRSIKADGTRLTGMVELSGELTHEGIYVWVRGLGTSTVTKQDGSFHLDLPPASQQPGNGITGQFTLYFFMSNFSLDSVSFSLRNGSAILPQDGFSSGGKLNRKIVLFKLMEIEHKILPAQIFNNDLDSVQNELSGGWFYLNLTDTVRVKSSFRFLNGGEDLVLNIPISHKTFPGFYLVINENTGIVTRVIDLQFSNWGRFVPQDGQLWTFESVLVFHSGRDGILSNQLPGGTYTIKPAFIITQSKIPLQLLLSLKPCLFDAKATSQFSRFPVKEKNGSLIVK